ncbi:MAG: NAD-dependent epimerase/dehydratase family protein [Deltaproteobacteria bacterium]|nr:NAD-dependent epimerase/dehydratase family protein [Deltaproteobacteria bacterium]
MDQNNPLQTAEHVVASDLDYITRQAGAEFARLSGRRLTIAGGAGFLGYYLVQSALHWNRRNPGSAPIDLIVLDSFVRGVPDWLTALESDPNLTLVRHDVTEAPPAVLGDLDYLIHAASIASPIYYRQHPIETMDANVGGLRHFLDYAMRQKQKGRPLSGILFYSSSEIYGDPTPDQIPTPETYRGNVSCTGPRACYDESKRYGETLCVNFTRQHGLPIKVARPFNNYGPGLKISDRRVIPDFARDILNGRDIVMLSDGAAMRTFCYSADAIAGYYKTLVNGRPGEAYNIGVETPEISMLELADRMVALGTELFGYRGRLVRKESEDKDYLVDNPNRRCPVITKARTELGYDPQVTLDEGLRRSLVWYSGNREAADL